MNPTPERRPSDAGFPDPMRVKLTPCFLRLPSSARRTSSREAMSISRLDSSCAIRAERRPGWLLLALSSIVLTFRQATFTSYFFGIC